MNFFIRVPIAVLLGLVVASPALASEWWFVTSATDGTVVFVDTSSIKIVNNRLEYWDYKINKATINGVKSTKARYSDSCIANKSNTLQVATYAEDGSVISSKTGPVSGDDNNTPVPDTIGENLHNFVCSTPAIRAKIGFRIATTPEFFAYEQQNGEPPPQ
jgi:hypothetical protein